MKAITIIQPWASLIAMGAKSIETRGWKTPYRGPIAIHAGASREFSYVLQTYPFRQYDLSDLPLGAVVATAFLIDILPILRPNSGSTWPHVATNGDGGVDLLPRGDVRVQLVEELGFRYTVHEAGFGDYSPGRWAWILGQVRPVPEPIPARGKQGLWDWEQPW